eukprot:1918843-Amphidinium_carterae.1
MHVLKFLCEGSTLDALRKTRRSWNKNLYTRHEPLGLTESFGLTFGLEADGSVLFKCPHLVKVQCTWSVPTRACHPCAKSHRHNAPEMAPCSTKGSQKDEEGSAGNAVI